MFRPSMDAKMKFHENTESGVGNQNQLESALKKLFGHICETLIIFQHKLQINGTIGITIDNESVMLLQFSELIINPSSHIANDKSLTSPKFSKLETERHLSNSINVQGNSCSNETISIDNYGEQVESLNHYSGLLHNQSTLPSPSLLNNQAQLTPPCNSNNNSDTEKVNLRSNNRCTSKLSQLLQIPITTDDLNSAKNYLSPNVSNINNNSKSWKPVSASEILKRMSTRVDNSVMKIANSCNSLNNNINIGGISDNENAISCDTPKSEHSFLLSILSGNLPSLSSISNMYNKKNLSFSNKYTNNKNIIRSASSATTFTSSSGGSVNNNINNNNIINNNSSNNGSSYLRELLFDKSSSYSTPYPFQTRTTTTTLTPDRKRKRLDLDTDNYNNIDNNSTAPEYINDDSPCYSTPTISNEGRAVKEEVNMSDPREFSDYRYSMLLHKLVGVRQNQHHEKNVVNSNYFNCNDNDNDGDDAGSSGGGDKDISPLTLAEIKKEPFVDCDNDTNDKHDKVKFDTGDDDDDVS